MTDGRLAWIIVIAILAIDQIIKIEVKTSMCLGESIRLTDWFYINFIENKGMAYGMSFMPKILLSVLRLVAISVIGWYIYLVVREKGRTLYIALLAMIVAGAAGNVIDCMFYGLIFNASSPFYVSYFVPFGTGYADFLMGKVVYMFYFPLIDTTWPAWVPFVGGERLLFFAPVFNFADSCVTVGAFYLILFQNRFFTREAPASSDTH